MTRTKMLAATASAALLGLSMPLVAQAPAAATAGAAVAQGAAVVDTQGAPVGKIETVEGDFVILATAKSKVKLPKSSFASGDKGLVIAMSEADIDKAAAQAAPQTAAAPPAAATKPNVVNGAQVADTQGGQVGTVSQVDGQFATVELATGGKVRLPVSAFGAGENGGLRIAMTAQQLSAAAGASAGAASTPKTGGGAS